MANSQSGRPGKGAPQNSPWRKPKVWGVATLIVALAAGGGAAWGLKDDDSTSAASPAPATPGQKWRDDVTRDLAGAAQGTLDYLKVVYDWNDGKADSARMSQAADGAFGRYMEALDFLSKRTAFGPAPSALANYRDTFQLYTETARLAKLGSGIESAELRTQIQRQILRLRALADRFFDLAKLELRPFTLDDVRSGPGFEFIRPAEVPSFAGTALAPGAPLPSPGPTVEQNRQFQEQRPEQEFATWLEAVKKAQIPPGQDVVDAITAGDANKLGQLAVALTKASDALYDAPDPKGSRHLATRITLGLLVQAEAMRTAQIATLANKTERPVAIQIAETLAFLGNRIWDPRLGDRATDLTERLLERKPI